jgi:hypothetical protein
MNHLVAAAIGIILCVAGSGGADNGEKMAYQLALKELEGRPTLIPGSSEERAAVERFKDFISVLSEETVRAKVREVYAEDAYFNDTLKELRGAAAIEDYMAESMGATKRVTAEITDLVAANGNYYFRWVMEIEFKNLNKGRVSRSIGMSHIRFDDRGKVALHQDYWDSTSGLFEHMPILGRFLRMIKERL